MPLLVILSARTGPLIGDPETNLFEQGCWFAIAFETSRSFRGKSEMQDDIERKLDVSRGLPQEIGTSLSQLWLA